MRRLIPLLIISLLLISAGLATGQEPTTAIQPPAIINFGSNLPAIAFTDAEAGETVATLSWNTLNIVENQQIALDTYRLHEWVSLLDEGEVLQPSGEHTLTVQHPVNFGPPTYRLSIVDESGRALDERIVTIDYTPESLAATPTIELFSSSAAEVVADEDGEARTPVAWSIANRTPTSYIAFEQILSDGEIVAVDLPRLTMWVPSAGEGQVAPVVPEDATDVTLVLRLVDAITGATLDSNELTLPAVVIPAATPEVPAPAATAEVPAATPEAAAPGVVIDAFAVDRASVIPGDTITLSWAAIGAGSVDLRLQTSESGTPTVLATGLAAIDTYTYTFPVTDDPANYGPLVTFLLDAHASDGTMQTAINNVVFSLSGLSIALFHATPAEAQPGSTVALAWRVEGEASVVLQQLNPATGILETVAENLPLAGSMQVTVPADMPVDQLPAPAGFVLRAEGPDGELITANAPYTVTAPSS